MHRSGLKVLSISLGSCLYCRILSVGQHQCYEPMQAFVQKETLGEEDPHRVERYFEAARSVAAELAVELRCLAVANQWDLEDPPELYKRV